MDTQPISNCCPKCRTPLPPDAPQGLCPKCLFAAVATPTEAGQPPGHRAAPPPLEEIAAAFPQLEILEFIGQGGMGFVFKARQPKLDRLVALKILPQSLAADPTFAERFNREARLLARLNHPGIVTVHDFGVASVAGQASSLSGEAHKTSDASSIPHPTDTNSHLTPRTPHFYYLLMEFVDGVNLRQAMQAGRFTPEQALAIVPRICDALQFAHNEGILHRDIKPENILLDAKGRVKLADFGIAKLMERGSATRSTSDLPEASSPVSPPSKSDVHTALTETGKALGTPNYMAPEQFERPQEADHRADIYSLGVVFYEMLTGELPLGRFAPPSQKSSADSRVDEVVLRALEKEKTKRYASADEVKTQVETIARSSGRESAPTKTGKPSTQLTRAAIARRSALVAAIVALVVFALAAVTTSLMPQTYVATARVTRTNDVISNYDPYQIQTDFARMESPDSLKQVGELANLRTRWRDQLFGSEYAQDNVIAVRLRGAMELRPVRGSALVEIRYHSTSAGEAADIANAIAKIYCQLSGAHLVAEALEPRTPVHPKAFINLAIGLGVGCVLGLIAGGLTALFLGRKRADDGATPPTCEGSAPRTKGPWVVASLFTLAGLYSLALMLFRQDASSMGIFPSALALPIGIGLFRGRESCRRLAMWGLAFSFIFTLVMCGWVVGKAFGLFPSSNLVAMFLGQPVDSHLGALALFALMLGQLIAYPWLFWTLIRSEVRAHFASPSRKLPGAEAGLTLVILLLMFTQVHVPVKRSWLTGIIFANPPTTNQTTDISPAAVEKLEQEANHVTTHQDLYGANPVPAMNPSFGPVMERVIHASREGKTESIDLDTGNIIEMPFPAATNAAAFAYMHEAGGDLLVEGPNLVGPELSAADRPDSDRDSLPADKAAETLRWTIGSKVRPIILRPHENNSATWTFRTAAGAVGVLQIIGRTENPRGVKIRYKLVQTTFERIIPVTGTGPDFYFDLDSGRLMVGPSIPVTDDKRGDVDSTAERWAAENGMDIMCRVLRSNVVNIAGKSFTDTNPLVCLGSFNLALERRRDTNWNPPVASITIGIQSAANRNSWNQLRLEDLPFAWSFKTREGGLGLLEILSLIENPPGVKLRYKLVQESSSTNAP